MAHFLGQFQWVLIIVVLACVGVIYRGIYERQRKIRRIREALYRVSAVSLADIPSLSEEAIRVFQDALGISLRYEDDFETQATLFDEALRSEEVAGAFAKPDEPYYFAMPLGAYMGEVLHFRGDVRWSTVTDQGPAMARPDGSGSINPLHMALIHHLKGKPGELKAALLMHSPNSQSDRNLARQA